MRRHEFMEIFAHCDECHGALRCGVQGAEQFDPQRFARKGKVVKRHLGTTCLIVRNCLIYAGRIGLEICVQITEELFLVIVSRQVEQMQDFFGYRY